MVVFPKEKEIYLLMGKIRCGTEVTVEALQLS